MKENPIYRKCLLAIALMLGAVIPLNAQTTVQIGTGTSSPNNTLYAPVYRFNAGSATTWNKGIMIFEATELATAGITAGATFTALSFNKTNTGHFLIPAQYTILMANTANTPPLPGNGTTYWPTVETTFDTVYHNSSFDIPDATGWMTIPLQTPFQYTGGSLEIAFDLIMTGGATGATGTGFKWEYTTGFATFIIGSNTSNNNLSQYKQRPNTQFTFFNYPLSADILSFKAAPQGQNVVARWEVAQEKNMAAYEVERSLNGRDFEKAGSVAANGDAISAAYSYTDRDIAGIAASTVYYRLKSVEKTGAFKYSPTTTVNVKGYNNIKLEAYPSPVQGVLTVSTSGTPGGNAAITVLDVNGKQIEKLNMSNSLQKISTAHWPAGIYFVKYTDDNYTETMRIVKQ